MGFMDKAKKLAEQAQEKLDEVQGQFNQGQQGPKPGEEAVHHDQQGRPVEEKKEGGPPAGEAPPPSGEPDRAGGPADANPDPFKPIE